ncbi:MAG: hypothetical protein ABI114_02590 [Rhodanobacter sp.]
MNTWLCVLAFVLATLSAVALYLASPHCLWTVARERPRLARMAGVVLALLALIIWINRLGAAVGLPAMLASWMLALIAQPYLALLLSAPDNHAVAMGKRP